MIKAGLFTTILSLLLLAACDSGINNSTETSNGAPNKKENAIPGEVKQLYEEVKLHPDSAGLRLRLATSLDSIKFYEEALQQMDSLISKDSLNYGLWYTNGRIAEDAGDTLQAMQSYDRAIRVYPSADAMLSLANLYAEQKNERSLIICANVKRLRLGREYDAHAAFVSGIYNARTKNNPAALKFFDECIANDYTYMEAYIEKGLLYFDSKQYREALNVFSFASTVNALDSDPYYWMGRCYEMLNVKDTAILRFKQSLNLSKNDKATEDALKRLGE
ncbi:MAG TPA: tetratricopeptide repeat protein [Panacibacter sp.]|nr:tetratricopeptide repeat protein [Panacibacter sp.]HNP43242.1 tetratricopeptide repeat protein [Panacibacter sp.]